MKWPFSPDILDAMPEALAELFRSLELSLLMEISTRLMVSGQLNEVTVQDIRALRRQGLYGAILGKAYYTGAVDLREALEAAK